MEQFPQPEPQEKNSAFKEKTKKVVKSITAGAMLGAGVFSHDEAQAQLRNLPPIITHNADDPRIKAYDDSLYAYKRGVEYQNEGIKIFSNDTTAFNEFEKKESPVNDPRIAHLEPKFEEWGEATRHTQVNEKGKEIPKSTGWKLNKKVLFPQYKQPVQPVFAEERTPIIVHDTNAVELKQYKDSTEAYEKTNYFIEKAQTIVKNNSSVKEKKEMIEKLLEEMEVFANQKINLDSKVESIVDPTTNITIPIPVYQKPEQEVIYKEKPTGAPVYGPSKGLVGFYTDQGIFKPIEERDHLSTDFYSADRELLEKYDRGDKDAVFEQRLKDQFGTSEK